MRPSQASPKPTPVMLVSTSIRRGGRPICTTSSGSARLWADTSNESTGAPNAVGTYDEKQRVFRKKDPQEVNEIVVHVSV